MFLGDSIIRSIWLVFGNMTAPNMPTITASIERSLQNFSLNHHQSSSSSSSNNSTSTGRARFVAGRSSTSDSTENHDLPNNALELQSEIRLPYHWEQCLDLKTGEVYYINWRTGMKSQEDPRTNPGISMNGGLLCSEEDDESSCDSEGSSTEESSPSTSRDQCHYTYNPPPPPPPLPTHEVESNDELQPPQVLVVAGCKSCFMYFMVPKQVEDCPKCFGQLLHFDRSENGSP